MSNVRNKKRVSISLPFFFRDSTIVPFIIILISIILLYITFTFNIVPPILNRGIQPATFPKALLILIISLTLIIFFLSIKNPWKKEKKLPIEFYITLGCFLLFLFVSKFVDFFLGISLLSSIVSYSWGEKRLIFILFVSILFPILVFIFFETILGLRFPSGIITDLYYS